MTTDKTILPVTMTILGQKHEREDWRFDFNSSRFTEFVTRMSDELAQLGYALMVVHNPDVLITVKSYADLLNAVKIVTPASNGVHCVGHCVGKSERLDIVEDIEAALRRVIFAPETIPPANEFRKVCHNCGCGC